MATARTHTRRTAALGLPVDAELWLIWVRAWRASAVGDDIWRELVERDNRDDVDEAWSAFRKQLELGREIEVVDENGDRIEYGDYPDEEDPEYD